MTYALALHGGAGAKPGTDYSEQSAHMKQLIEHGQSMLVAGAAACDVVAEICEMLETSGLYVAGKGSAPNSNGKFELDASIMNGRDQSAGGVAALAGIESPIRAADAIRRDGRYVLLAGEGANRFAVDAGCTQVGDPLAYYSEHEKHGSTDREKAHGTVGAVALDLSGGLAAGTTTGGLFNKPAGRVGDTPLIGSGTWADDRIAVSCTGVGEAFIRTATAHDVAARIAYGQEGLKIACDNALNAVRRVGGDGGLIAINNRGEIAMPFNSHGMKRASVSSNTSIVVRVFEPED